MRSLLEWRTEDNRPQRSLGDSRVWIALNECQHGEVEIKDLEYLRDTGARHAQAAREFSLGFTALLHGASPIARGAYRIGTAALPRRGHLRWFKGLIPRKAVAPFTVDSLPAAIKVKGNIEFEAVRMFPRFGEPLNHLFCVGAANCPVHNSSIAVIEGIKSRLTWQQPQPPRAHRLEPHHLFDR